MTWLALSLASVSLTLAGSPEGYTPPLASAECIEPALEFVSPLNGATVDSPLTVHFRHNGVCECNDEDCWQNPLSDIVLIANGESYPANTPLDEGSTNIHIEVELPPGVHELTIEGMGDNSTTSDSIAVSVRSVEESETSGEGGGEAGDAEDGEGGCSITSTDPRSGFGFGLGFALLGLVSLRRHRGAARS